MVLISLHRPTKEQRQNIVRRGLKLADQFISPQNPVQRLGPNHAFSGATRKAPLLPNQLNSALWRILCRSVIVYLYKEDHIGKGKTDYNRAKALLQTWAHFRLSWTFVETSVPIRLFHGYCNQTKILLPWIVNPLRIEYVEEQKKKNGGRSFCYGTTTLHGHILSGEERFKIDWDTSTNDVTYEIYSFSRPGHILGVLGYPLVYLLQSCFVHQSLSSLKHKLKDM